MRRDRSIDASLVVGAVLASVVFVTGLAAVSGFAAKMNEKSATRIASQSASVEIAGESGFRLEMDLLAGEVVPGGRVEYLVRYENVGPITETVSITDTMPFWSNFGGAWWGEGDQPNAGQPLTTTVVFDEAVIWDLGQLEGGGARWFHVEVWLSPDLQVGQTITNTTEIAPASFETSLDDNHDIRVDVLNDFGPNLAVSKAHEWSLPGYERLSYSIDFWNLGTIPQSGVVIEDTLPVTTTYGGSWSSEFPDVIAIVEEPGRLVWEVFNLEPGETGQINFEALLDDPGVPLQWFTNTVQIESQAGDVDPGDNQYEDVAFSGNSITEVHLEAEMMNSDVWGFAHVYDAITGTVQLEVGDQTLVTDWDLTCGGCWEFPDVGPILGGDTITVTVGAGIPVVIDVPTPFIATADSDINQVWGQIDHLDGEPVEVALRQAGTLLVTTDNNGSFAASFPDIPHGDQGEVRYSTEVNWAEVVFHRRVYNPDVVMNVNYAHDWVEGPYEVGHTVWITVTDSTGAVKATSQLETWLPPWWNGDSGFTTLIDGAWSPEPPDIQPGDWVYVNADHVKSAATQVGVITGELDYNTDVISGTITAPWLEGLIDVHCEVLEVGGAAGIDEDVDPNGGIYVCDFAGVWDLQPGHSVLVLYNEPDNHSVMNVFQDLPPQLEITKRGEGQPTTGGNFEYVVTFGNVGGGTAENTYITDTLPVGVSYLGNTSTFTVTHTVSDTLSIAVFDVGFLEPDVEVGFSLFAQINAPMTSAITNTVEISASNVVTMTAPGPAGWGNVIQPNETDLAVAINPRPAQPAPGGDLYWDLEVCNEGVTSSSTAVVTYTLPASTTLLSFWSDDPGWEEVPSQSNSLVVSRPTVSGSRCTALHLHTSVAQDVMPNDLLCGQSLIAAANDVNQSNDTNDFCVTVADPHVNVAVHKHIDSGVAIPGGRLDYGLGYENAGNVGVGTLVLTDTLPIGATFDSAWLDDGTPFEPTFVTSELVGWEIPELGAGLVGSFHVRVNIQPDIAPDSVLTNTVQITPLAGEDSYDDNTDNAVARLNPPGPNLAVTKWHEWRVPDLDHLAYEINFWNFGDEPVDGFVITDTLPVGTAWSGAWESNDPERISSFQSGSGGLIWGLSNLAPGEGGWVRFAVDLDEPATPGRFFVNTVEISMPPGETNPEDNQFEDLAYVGSEPVADVAIRKLTNGEDADSPPGPYIPVGQPVTWTYSITNTGNITLTAVTAVDDQAGVTPECPGSQLGPQESMECTANGVAVAGQYENLGTVTAEPPVGDPVEATDPSHYFGLAASIELTKRTNQEDADIAPGPYISVGRPVTWTYAITNTGNITLTSVTAVDDQAGVIPDCPASQLGPQESMECTASGVAVAGQYENIGTANGSPPVGDPVGDSDPSHYFGLIAEPLFEDGFESGNTSAWSRTVP